MMKRRQWLQNAWGLGVGLTALKTHARESLQWKKINFIGLGTALSIEAAHEDMQTLSQALAQAKTCVQDIEAQMSLFQTNSALQRLNRDGVLHQAPHHLLAVMRQAQHYAQESAGRFDATVQPLWQVFEQARLQQRVPNHAEVAQARTRVGWQHVVLNEDSIVLKRPGMGVTLNGIAQGYASDQVANVLRSHGVEHALINAGEWRAVGHSPRNDDWVIGVSDPRESDAIMARLRASGACVATSADDQTYFTADRRHHHIFDPHTGYSPRDIASVSVVASTCTQADALTKVLFVAGFEHALNEAKRWGVEALVVSKTGQYQMTQGLPLV